MDYSQINSEVLQALKNDHSLKLKQSGVGDKEVLRGICPSCEKKTLWIKVNKPITLRCDREKECRYEERVRDRYPDLFENFSKRFPSSDEDPKATARAYLSIQRGFPAADIEDWFEQGFYKLPDGSWAETVRFLLFGGEKDYWERIVDKQHVKKAGKKARFKTGTSYAGKHWAPPGQKIKPMEKVFIVEGIFHCIAMHLKGYKAVCAFSCSNLPREFIKENKGQGIIWHLAYDDEPGARSHVAKYYKELKKQNETVEVAQTGSSKDWDDLYREGRLNDETIDNCVWRGRVFVAETPKRKAYAQYGWKPFGKTIIEHNDRLHSVKFSLEDFNKASEGEPYKWGFSWDAFNQAAKVEQISNCVPKFQYTEIDRLTNERRYFFAIKKSGTKRSYLGAFTPNALSDPRAFGLALLSHTDGGSFEGGAGDLKILKSRWLDGEVNRVTTLPHMGFDENTRTYIFPGFGYQNGKLITANEHGFLQQGDTAIKTTLEGMPVHQSDKFDGSWWPDFVKVFHLNGIAALAYFTASLFARQIKERHQAFHILEITGDPDAGKSTLIRFIWKLLGRDNYEGVDLLSTSTSSYGRNLGKVSNLPVVVIESDRETSGGTGGRPAKSFEWDIFKKITDLDGVIDSRGVKTNDNKTHDRIFRGSMVISQNATVHASAAMLSRIVHLHCTTAHKRTENRPLADRLKREPVENLAGYLHQVLTHETEWLSHFFNAFESHRETLTADKSISQGRVIDFHAQLMAAVEALQVVLPDFDASLINQVQEHLVERARDRQRRLNKDHPIIEQFWDTYHFLNDQVVYVEDDQGKRHVNTDRLNHSIDPALIAINLNEYMELCRKRGQELIPVAELKQLFPTSQRYPFAGYKRIRSKREKKASPWCWVFKRTGGSGR
ncbi:toprim domain-containing protein [Microbulbifer sp. OS29]|uniref:Toprim domain-containing protein n=1 Tax=Microbulbifer okhotskensis TaxID=2926617 RepID=A0A9X2EQ94_9GAMM|nr:toprim domain-containing protein [Microbulbifer okhotskensis]MCO1336412.1 toprim domain-containing protein [Microbulbifer okhotskensis]